jgi:hypothetical protein
MALIDQLPDPVCVIAAICKYACACGQVFEQAGSKRRVVGLSSREFELQGQTMPIHPHMQLGGQSASAATDMIISTLFFWAAACW